MALTEVAPGSNQYLTLPMLKPHVKYQGMPKRYDDTRPVVIQNFSHQRILELGTRIHSDTVVRCEREKTIALKSTEESLWAKAEVIKQETVERALKKAKAIHEREIRKLIKSHEKTLKDEILKVEQEMQRLSSEQLKKQREESEKKLKDTVEELETRLIQEKIDAVSQARREEIENAKVELDTLKKNFAVKYNRVVEESNEEKEKALKSLEVRLIQEKHDAIAKVQKEEKQACHAKLAHQQDIYEQNIKVLHTYIAEHKETISELEKEIEAEVRRKKRVIKELLETRDCFQQFIDHVKPFEPGKSEYVIPPIHSFVLK